MRIRDSVYANVCKTLAMYGRAAMATSTPLSDSQDRTLLRFPSASFLEPFLFDSRSKRSALSSFFISSLKMLFGMDWTTLAVWLSVIVFSTLLCDVEFAWTFRELAGVFAKSAASFAL